MITFIMKEAHYVASNIPIFFLKNAEFACSVDKYQPPPSVEQKRFLYREGIKKYKIIKFRFAPKLPRFSINKKCSMGVWSLHILYSINLNGSLGANPSVWQLWRYTTKESIFRHVSAEILPKKFLETCLLLNVRVLKFSILTIILFEH